MERSICLAALAGGLIHIAGCSNATETGYVPRKLSDSQVVQRAYYAPQFSPEQRAAESERQTEMHERRPTDLRPRY